MTCPSCLKWRKPRACREVPQCSQHCLFFWPLNIFVSIVFELWERLSDEKTIVPIWDTAPHHPALCFGLTFTPTKSPDLAALPCCFPQTDFYPWQHILNATLLKSCHFSSLACFSKRSLLFSALHRFASTSVTLLLESPFSCISWARVLNYQSGMAEVLLKCLHSDSWLNSEPGHDISVPIARQPITLILSALIQSSENLSRMSQKHLS